MASNVRGELLFIYIDNHPHVLTHTNSFSISCVLNIETPSHISRCCRQSLLQPQIQSPYPDRRFSVNIAMDSYQVPLDSSFALEKYLLLHSEHDALHQHISQICASIPDTANISPPVSPTRSRTGSISSSSSDDNSIVTPVPARRHHRRSERRPATFARTPSLPTVVDESIIGEIQSSDIKIRDVNLEIKSTLTELLNNPSVRKDCKYRSWVQTRLMDAERELRGARRRRSD